MRELTMRNTNLENNQNIQLKSSTNNATIQNDILWYNSRV